MSRLIGIDAFEARVRRIEQRVEKIERQQPRTLGVSDGTRVRVRVGQHSDGKFGVWVYDAGGGLVFEQSA